MAQGWDTISSKLGIEVQEEQKIGFNLRINRNFGLKDSLCKLIFEDLTASAVKAPSFPISQISLSLQAKKKMYLYVCV